MMSVSYKLGDLVWYVLKNEAITNYWQRKSFSEIVKCSVYLFQGKNEGFQSLARPGKTLLFIIFRIKHNNTRFQR